MTLGTSTKIETDIWLRANWEEFLRVADDPAYLHDRSYYDHGQIRIEIAALGSAYARDNALVVMVIILFATPKNFRVKQLLNANLRKGGLQECQPDAAFYIGDDEDTAPWKYASQGRSCGTAFFSHRNRCFLNQ